MLVVTTGTAAMQLVDSVDGVTANIVIGVVPANTAAGTVLDFQMPALVGIWCKGNAANPGVTVAFS
jgi:hypothetical protein